MGLSLDLRNQPNQTPTAQVQGGLFLLVRDREPDERRENVVVRQSVSNEPRQLEDSHWRIRNVIFR
jgi:hypothetical protein